MSSQEFTRLMGYHLAAKGFAKARSRHASRRSAKDSKYSTLRFSVGHKTNSPLKKRFILSTEQLGIV